MFLNKEIECCSRVEMRQFQEGKLKETVRYAYEKIPFYRKQFDECGVHPDDIKTLADLPNLPFTTKSDFRDHYPLGFCAVPIGDIVRIHASSGTTGKPTPVFYTKRDLENWTLCMARNCYTAGVRKEDICQIAYGYTLFTGAFGHHRGVERIGAAIIPTSSGQTERQILMMKDFKTTVLHCTPSYAITIAEHMIRMGIEKASLSLRLGIHGAEPMSEGLREEIEEKLGITAVRDYGLTELGGPGVSIECREQAGFHINEDYYLPEIVVPETLEPLPPGQKGELVISTLQKEATPIIRYRTRDISSLETEKCDCGRTLIRHTSIFGRTDDMMIIGGVNFFPSQIESVLLGFDEIEPHYLIRITQKGRRDYIIVDMETEPDFWAQTSEVKRTELCRRIEAKTKDIIGFRMDIRLVDPFSIPRSEGKAKRVVDERTACGIVS